MSANGEAINFVAVARKASVSTDFLYRHPSLWARVLALHRPSSGVPLSGPGPSEVAADTSSAVRSLAAQLKQLRASHRQEVAQLQKALAAAHGENLRLRRLLGQGDAP